MDALANVIPHFGATANAVDTYEVSAPIKASADKFFGFFKFSMNELVTIFPACFKAAQLLEGEEGTVGCVKLWKYVLGGVTLTAKVKTEAIDNEGKSITFVVLEGDLLLLYKSFKVSLAVTDGLVKWTFTFEKLSLLTPIPELYGPIVITASILVDSYLLIDKANVIPSSEATANAVDTYEVSAPIKTPADKFFGFFKFDMNELVTIFPACFKAAQLLEGEEGTVGCVKLWKYILGGVTLTAKVKTEAIDDEGKSITFTVLEGDLLLLYKSFKVSLTVTDGLAKWSFAYEKLTFLTPIPELYGPIVITTSTLVDAYLLISK